MALARGVTLLGAKVPGPSKPTTNFYGGLNRPIRFISANYNSFRFSLLRANTLRFSLRSGCFLPGFLPSFFRHVGYGTPTTPRLLHRRNFCLLACTLRAFLLSSLGVPRFPRRGCPNFATASCRGKRFCFVGGHHRQSMLLGGLHSQHRRVLASIDVMKEQVCSDFSLNTDSCN